MNKNYLYIVFTAFLLNNSSVWAMEKPDQMTQELNAQVPEWLSLGTPIKVEPVKSVTGVEEIFRTRSGGATNSRNRVQIPSRGIQIELDYEIDWTGNNEAGTGVSLSPDGKRLVVNSGPISHLYEIEPDGSHREAMLQLPHVTYDSGIKGYLRGWSWADDQTLIAQAEITDESGHKIIENRIYVFHMKDRALSRLDLSALNLLANDSIEVVGIGNDLNQLKLSVGGALVVAKADLKSPPKIEIKKPNPQSVSASFDADKQLPGIQAHLDLVAQSTSEGPAVKPTWSIIAVLIVATFCLFWLLKNRRSKV